MPLLRPLRRAEPGQKPSHGLGRNRADLASGSVAPASPIGTIMSTICRSQNGREEMGS